MARYKARPTVVEAVQFDPHVKPWPAGVISWQQANYRPRGESWGFIQTDVGRLHVGAGDWVITNALGEVRVCKADMFRWLYEKIEEREEVK